MRNELSSLLSRVYDIQRLSTRLSNASANPRDFLSLKDTLFLLPEIATAIEELHVSGSRKS